MPLVLEIIEFLLLIVLIDVAKIVFLLIFAAASSALALVLKPIGLPIRPHSSFEKKIFSQALLTTVISLSGYLFAYALIFRPELFPLAADLLLYVFILSAVLTLVVSTEEYLPEDFEDADLGKTPVSKLSKDVVDSRLSSAEWGPFRLSISEIIFGVLGNVGLSILASSIALLYDVIKNKKTKRSEPELDHEEMGPNSKDYYEFERYYYREKSFSFFSAMVVTVRATAGFCNGFDAVITRPGTGKKTLRKRGELPEVLSQRQEYLEKLLDWTFRQTKFTNMFRLVMYDTYPETHHEVDPRFGYYAETGTWYLRLTKKEFSQIQTMWARNNLPKDLFYNEKNRVQIQEQRLKRIWQKAFFLFWPAEYLTPKEAAENNKNEK